MPLVSGVTIDELDSRPGVPSRGVARLRVLGSVVHGPPRRTGDTEVLGELERRWLGCESQQLTGELALQVPGRQVNRR